MFISVKRHEREKQDLIGASNRLTDAFLKSSTQGVFLVDAKDKILPQVSTSLAALSRRQNFTNLSCEKLLGPVVGAKTLSVARTFVARLLDAAASNDAARENPLQDVEVRLAKPDGNFEPAHYPFEFSGGDAAREPRAWLARVTDITARGQQQRHVEEPRPQVPTQREVWHM